MKLPDVFQFRLSIPFFSIGGDLMVYYHQLGLKHFLYLYVSIFKWGFSFQLGKKNVELAKKSDGKARAVVQKTTGKKTPRLVPSE